MTRLRTVVASVVVLVFVVAGCESDASLAPEADAPAPGPTAAVVDGDAVSCQSTGTGLTAALVNEDVVGRTIDVGACDVGAFFDEDGVVRNSTFEQPDPDGAGAGTDQYLVRVEGAEVDVTGSHFEVTDDYRHQIIHVALAAGASGVVAGNELTGFKRVGILLTGEGTSGTVKRNRVTGVGEKDDGWAENGIQVSAGATAAVMANTVEDHWWDRNDFVSSGIIVFGSDGVTLQRNTLTGNDVSLVLDGDGNNAVHNTVEATAPDGSRDGTLHFGAIVNSGRDNGLRQNEFSSTTDADVGVFVSGASGNTKLIRNSFDGFAQAIADQGEATKLPRPFVP
jgi:hypothetical protein